MNSLNYDRVDESRHRNWHKSIAWSVWQKADISIPITCIAPILLSNDKLCRFWSVLNLGSPKCLPSVVSHDCQGTSRANCQKGSATARRDIDSFIRFRRVPKVFISLFFFSSARACDSLRVRVHASLAMLHAAPRDRMSPCAKSVPLATTRRSERPASLEIELSSTARDIDCHWRTHCLKRRMSHGSAVLPVCSSR